jgi:hypothetical protein
MIPTTMRKGFGDRQHILVESGQSRIHQFRLAIGHGTLPVFRAAPKRRGGRRRSSSSQQDRAARVPAKGVEGQSELQKGDSRRQKRALCHLMGN